MPAPQQNIPALSDKSIDILVDDLKNGRRSSDPGGAVVIAGAQQPASVHALAHAINASLGNVGSTVIYTDPVDASPTTPGTLELRITGTVNDTRTPANALVTPVVDDTILTIDPGSPPATTPIVVEIWGRTTRQKVSDSVAPSTAAASISSLGTALIAAERMTIAKPVWIQMRMTISHTLLNG